MTSQRSLVVLAATLTTWVVLAPSGAAASPSSPSTSPATPAPTAALGPVEDLVMPVLPLTFGFQNIAGDVTREESPKTLKVTLDSTVLFGFDSAKLTSRARTKIRAAASILRRRPPGRLRIVGYTDNLGSAAHGLDLSRRRARAVATTLRPLLPRVGYPFAISGRGEKDPVASNDHERTRRLNRRVELTLGS